MNPNLLPQALKKLIERLDEKTEQKRVTCLATCICEAVHSRRPKRQRWRTYRSTGHIFLGMLHLLVPIKTNQLGNTWLPFISRVSKLGELLDVVTKMGIQWMRTSVAAQTQVTFHTSGLIRNVLRLMRTSIEMDIFKNIEPSDSQQLKSGFVWQRMRDLAVQMPAEYAFVVPVDVQRPSIIGRYRDLEGRDVEKLLEYTRGCPQDSLLIILLSTTGLRIEALSRIKVDDVWNSEKGTPKSCFVVQEKCSKNRVIYVSETLAKSVSRCIHYLQHRRKGQSVWLFATREVQAHRPPSVRGLRRRVTMLLQRAGIPHSTVHAFRRFVVNHAMENGATIGDVSSYIGHESSSTTFTHYWTKTVNEQVNRAMDEPETSVVKRLKLELENIERAIQEAETGMAAIKTIPHIEEHSMKNEIDVVLSTLCGE